MRMRRLIALAATICLLAVSICAFAEDGDDLIQDYSGSQRDYGRAVAELNKASGGGTTGRRSAPRAQRFIVMCRTDGSDVPFADTEPVTVLEGPDHRFTCVYASYEAADAAVNYLNACEGIRYAEHDGEVEACADGEASFHSDGAAALNMGGYLPLARVYGTGSQTVAIVDSGIARHSDLVSRVRSYGYDYVDADSDPTNDGAGHGTHIAGIVAECTAGTGVNLYPIRILNDNGKGSLSNLANGILEASNAGVDIINLSLCSTVHSQNVEDAILAARDRGITVVIAAGNSAGDTSNYYPSNMTDVGVIVVGSVNGTLSSHSRAGYSNYGSSVDLYAFGTGIESCAAGGGYTSLSGTSQATAHISAACALMGLTLKGQSPAGQESLLKQICTGGDLPVPDMSRMPVARGFDLSGILLAAGDSLLLPTRAVSASDTPAILWTSSDPGVAAVDAAGMLWAHQAGTATLTASCMGFSDASVTLTVSAGDGGTLTLPEGIEEVGEEAFAGTGAAHIEMMDAVTAIGERAFADAGQLSTVWIPPCVTQIGDGILSGSGQAVILCEAGSEAFEYARDRGLQYIIEWN